MPPRHSFASLRSLLLLAVLGWFPIDGLAGICPATAPCGSVSCSSVNDCVSVFDSMDGLIPCNICDGTFCNECMAMLTQGNCENATLTGTNCHWDAPNNCCQKGAGSAAPEMPASLFFYFALTILVVTFLVARRIRTPGQLAR